MRQIEIFHFSYYMALAHITADSLRRERKATLKSAARFNIGCICLLAIGAPPYNAALKVVNHAPFELGFAELYQVWTS